MHKIIKTASYFILLGLIFSCCKPKHSDKDDIDKFHKKRPVSPFVKSLKVFSDVTDSSHTKGIENLNQTEEYDNKGQKVKLTHYIGDSGKIDYITTYKYDDNGNAIQTHTIYPNDHNESTEKNYFDDHRHLIKTEWTRGDGSYGTHEYKYDKFNALVQWDSYEKGHFMITRLYPMVYDKDGRLTESFAKETTGGKDTTLQGHERYNYDSTSGLESAKMIFYGDIPLEILESHYDTARNKILEIHYEMDSGGLKPNTRIMNVFDVYGEMTSTTTYKDGKEQSNTENSYDMYGHLIETIKTEGTIKKMTRYLYEFYK